MSKREKNVPGDFDERYFESSSGSNYGAMGGYHRLGSRPYWEKQIKFVLSNGQEGRVLDFGCAYAYLFKWIGDKFTKPVGTDISLFAIKQAKVIAPEDSTYRNYLVVSDEKLPFLRDYFDTIVAFEVLEHTNDLTNSLELLFQHLKPGGVLIGTMPVKGGFTVQLLDKISNDPTHVSIPTKEELEGIVCKLGFITKEITYGWDNTFRIMGKYLKLDTGKIQAKAWFVLQKPEI